MTTLDPGGGLVGRLRRLSPTDLRRGASPIEPLQQALMLAEAALDKKSKNPVLLEVTNLVSYADYLLILTGTSAPHVQAIAQGCLDAVKGAGQKLYSKEGMRSARWVLLDFGDVVAHVFQPDERLYYDLETLWIEAPRVDIPGADDATELAPIFATR